MARSEQGTLSLSWPLPIALLPRGSAPPPFMQGTRAFVLHYVRARPGALGVLFVLVVCAAGAAVGAQYCMKFVVDAMSGPRDGDAVWIALSVFAGLIALESVLWRLSGWLGCRTTVDIGVHVRLDLFGYLNGQPMRYFAENLAGSLGQRVTVTAGNFGALINTLIWRIMPPVGDFVGAIVIFATIDWRMMLVLTVYVTLVTILLVIFGERGRPRHREYSDLAGAAAGDVVDVITNMWSVKAFSARRSERDRLHARFDVEAAAQRRSWMYTEKARVLHDIALLLMTVGMLGWAVTLWTRGQVTPGEVVVVSTLTFRILHGSRDMALSLVDIAQQIGFIDGTLRIIAQPQTVVDVPDAPPLDPLGGEITFYNVRFAYGEGRDAVQDLNFTIPAGQKVGIVGPSGAGKSTLIQLLQRLHDVQEGEIRIGGQSIASVQQDSLRAALAVVPQEITLFHRTVRENIMFANPQASELQLFNAARAAACEGFIRRLPQGYDTMVGERGTRLSGGQRQRIGLARAFLKDAPIIVLDEATSALDTEAEMEIQRALVEHLKDRTVIAVAHRLSTLATFDRVLVIVDGRVVEDGAPADLRRKDGPFDRMWRLQAGGLSFDHDREDRAA